MLDTLADSVTQETPSTSEVHEAYETIAGGTGSKLIIICDHASNRIPDTEPDLGLPQAQMERHIAYDIGVEKIVRHMAARLDAPAILSRFSRLLIDPNRGLDDPTLVMRISDGAVIPGNANVTEQEIQRRISQYYLPYHNALAGMISTCIEDGCPPVLLSIHSFTPQWKDVVRPWHAGILWDKDPRFAVPMIEALRQEPGLVIGDNEPYRGYLAGDCMYRHATLGGLSHALLEIRHDLIDDDAGVKEWGDRLSRITGQLIVRDGLHEIVHYGSHSD